MNNKMIVQHKMLLPLFLITCAGLFFTTCENGDINGNISVNYQSELQKMLDEKWSDYVADKPNYPGGYGLLVIKDENEYYAATGELKNLGDQVHFRAASTTKTFTGAAILLLHQRKLLNINHLIIENIPGTTKPYIPDIDTFNIPYKEQITIKLLLQHRAGVFDIMNTVIPDTVVAPYAGYLYAEYILQQDQDHTFTHEECINVVAKHQLYYFAPNKAFHYSDLGSRILTYIIERVTGQSYAEFLEENLLIPNNLMNTSFPSQGTDHSIPAPIAKGYVFDEGIVYDVTEQNVSVHVGEGNVIITPDDLTNWIDLLLRGKAGIDKKYVEFMMMDCLPTLESHQFYGLHCVLTPSLGYGHNGGTLGYWTVSRHNPEWDLTFTVFSNVWDWQAIIVDFMTQPLELYDIGSRVGDIFSSD
ncbi:beta-lactamase family protein [Patescibacteria group bacterium]|nr:beta-lactamase family protein [Patescibacteria group bacterium]